MGELHRLARRQHGLVTRRQLLERGFDRHAIDRRLESRRLIRVRRGIYRLGPMARSLEAEMAAILATGAGAVLSHHSAAGLHQLLPHPAQPGLVDITVSGRQPGWKPGIRLHRTARLPPDETTSRQGIPVTSPARTILDLVPTLTEAQLEQALAQAHRKRLASPQALLALIDRYPRRPGVPALRSLLERPAKPAFTRSNPERSLLDLIRRAELPEPETNAELAGFEVDFLWSDQKLVVEVDGHPFHSARPDRRRDYARDATLAELGYTVLRLDPDDVIARPEATVALLARATR